MTETRLPQMELVTATHVEKKDFGTKVKEGAKNAVEKVRKMSDELVKKIKGKPKEGRQVPRN